MSLYSLYLYCSIVDKNIIGAPKMLNNFWLTEILDSIAPHLVVIAIAKVIALILFALFFCTGFIDCLMA